MLILLSFLSGIAFFSLSHMFPASTIIIFTATSAFLLFRKRSLLVPFIVIGFLYAFFRYSPPADLSPLSGKELLVDCVVKDPQHPLPSGRFVNEVTIGAAVSVETGDAIETLKGRDVSIISDTGLVRNARYEMKARMGQDAARLNPGAGEGERTYAYLKEILREERIERNILQGRLLDRRERLNAHLRNTLNTDSAALVASITTGERSGMSEEVRDAFSTTGLTHLLSISGTHFGLFSMLIFGIFRLGINLMPYRHLQRFTLYLTPSQAAAMLSLPFMLMYLFISGPAIPAVRSFIMITIFLGGLLIGRKGAWLNSLLFAAFIICLWDPSSLLSLSFQLSFLAVLFIGFSVGDKEEGPRDQQFSGRILHPLKKTVLLSLAASLGTAPLVAYSFHYFSVLSPVSNLVITPFVGFILLPLSLLSAFIFIFSGYFPFHHLIALTSEAALKGVGFFASIPFADIRIPAFPAVTVVIFYAGCILYIAGGKRLALALTVLAAGILLVPDLRGEKEISVTYLDVGQGDSAVIEASGATFVIDTGRTGKELDAYMRYRGKRDIDALILTHADDDHSGGTQRIMRSVRVREVWDSGLLLFPEGLLGDAVHRTLERGDEVTFGGLRLLALHPYKGFYTFEGGEATTENNDSLVVKITGKNSFLFTADAEREAEEDMAHIGPLLKSDVAKIAHHGSRTSTTADFLHEVSPEIAVISAGRYNSYGHPHQETLERLQGRKVYRTDRDGAVKITEMKEGLAVKTYRDFGFEKAKDLAAEWRNLKRLFTRW